MFDTCCLDDKQQLLENLHTMRPSLVLITSDFSSLPDVKVPGVRAPIVASKVAFSPSFTLGAYRLCT